MKLWKIWLFTRCTEFFDATIYSGFSSKSIELKCSLAYILGRGKNADTKKLLLAIFFGIPRELHMINADRARTCVWILVYLPLWLRIFYVRWFGARSPARWLGLLFEGRQFWALRSNFHLWWWIVESWWCWVPWFWECLDIFQTRIGSTKCPVPPFQRGETQELE